MSTLSTAAEAPAERATANRWLVLVLVCAAQFMVVLDATIVNVALPSIQRGLQMSLASLQWVVNSYAIVCGGFLLLGGRASDLYGRRRLFLAGVAVFTLASLLSGVAGSTAVLISGRSLQGLGAALVSPAALAIVTTTFTEPRERAKALGVWSSMVGFGGAVGLIAGGLLTQELSWRWVFLINLPIGAAASALALRYISDSRPEERPQSSDALGAVTVTAGLLALSLAIVKGPAYGWTAQRTAEIALAALALLVAFVLVERRSPAPLVRFGLFRLRGLAAANGAICSLSAGLFAMFYFAGLYLQQVLGYRPLAAGLSFIPFTVGMVGGASVSQRLVHRLGARRLACSGLTFGAAGLVLFARLPASGSYLAHFFPALALVSLGMGVTFVPLTVLGMAHVAPHEAGIASGVLNTSRQIGAALGLAVLATLAATRTSHLLAAGAGRGAALTDGFRLGFAVGGAAMLLAIVLLAVNGWREHHAGVEEGQPHVP